MNKKNCYKEYILISKILYYINNKFFKIIFSDSKKKMKMYF